MPRFTIKDLLIATTLIAIGAGLLTFQFQHRNEIFNRRGMGAVQMLWLCGGACIGAGIFTPFKLPIRGAVIGFLIQFLILLAFMR